jgi:hypothetical protein
MQTTSDIAIIHLVRAANDPKAAARFVDSYLKHPAGCDHRLFFLLKGFPQELPRELAAILDRVPHVRMVCPDRGYDIGSYYHAAERTMESLVMFLNSFSIIQGDLWLLKLAQAYRVSGTGLVGASGSWESLASTRLDAPICGGMQPIRRRFARLWAWMVGLPLWMSIPAFPNPHVRTNAFLMAREDFLAARPPRIHFKFQAWLFESGRVSMTRSILRRGLRVVVVGRDGTEYGMEDWSKSRTFWQDEQENLLIHDNQSMAYARADAYGRARLCRAAWNCRRDRR